jgi:hypothetical protein
MQAVTGVVTGAVTVNLYVTVMAVVQAVTHPRPPSPARGVGTVIEARSG